MSLSSGASSSLPSHCVLRVLFGTSGFGQPDQSQRPFWSGDVFKILGGEDSKACSVPTEHVLPPSSVPGIARIETSLEVQVKLGSPVHKQMLEDSQSRHSMGVLESVGGEQGATSKSALGGEPFRG